jgi:hypothetical protein
MSRTVLHIACLGCLGLGTLLSRADEPKDEPPTQQVLSNKSLKLTIYMPDPDKGYYRGVRFDWSGLVARAEYKKHVLFGEWKTPHKPDDPEGALGTAEEFGVKAPLGYADAQAGETFVKIGVGVLRKEKDEDYSFMRPYPIASATWNVKADKDSITFTQSVQHDAGWGYRYVKRLGLDGDKPAWTISHELQNTGKKAIDTDVYCHNFFICDGDPIGTNYRIKFGFPAKPPEKHQLGELAEVGEKGLVFRRDLGDKTIYAELEGLTGKTADHNFTVEHTKSRIGLRVVGDTPLSGFHVWAIKTALCPEPFVAIKVAPGESMKWSTRYEVVELDAKKP